MGDNIPAPIHYVAAHLNVAKAAVHLYLTRGLCFSIHLNCILLDGKQNSLSRVPKKRGGSLHWIMHFLLNLPASSLTFSVLVSINWIIGIQLIDR